MIGCIPCLIRVQCVFFFLLFALGFGSCVYMFICLNSKCYLSLPKLYVLVAAVGHILIIRAKFVEFVFLFRRVVVVFFFVSLKFLSISKRYKQNIALCKLM